MSCEIVKKKKLNILSIDLQTKLGPLPVSPFGIVADLVASFKAEPLGKWPVLLLLAGKDLFYFQGFVRSHDSLI